MHHRETAEPLQQRETMERTIKDANIVLTS
jgi:hypothetical protein